MFNADCRRKEYLKKLQFPFRNPPPPRANYMKLKVKPCNLKQFLKLYIDQKTANFSPSLNFKIMTVYCILHVYFNIGVNTKYISDKKLFLIIIIIIL